MEIVVGTFEQLLLGYKLKEKNGKFSLHLRFTNHSHMGAVKSMAISENGVLASGSSDETVQLFNLVKGVQLGSLFFHDGSINCLQFFDSSHLFSGSDDGKIAIWKMGSWERQKALKGHRQPVYGFAVHPTGKLGLSVGKDKTLHTWDLTKGKRGFVINTKQVADSVKWSPDGSMFVVIFDNTLDIYSTVTASIVHHILSSFKISCVEFIKPEILAVGGAEGIVTFHCTKTGQMMSELKTNTIRVKSLAVVEGPGSSDVSLVTASSDGFIKIFKISFQDEAVSGDLLAEVQTKFRLICCAAFGRISLASASVSSPPSSDSETTTPKQDISSADEDGSHSSEEGDGSSSEEEGGKTFVKESKLKTKEKSMKLKKKKKTELQKNTEDKKRFRVKEGRIENILSADEDGSHSSEEGGNSSEEEGDKTFVKESKQRKKSLQLKEKEKAKKLKKKKKTELQKNTEGVRDKKRFRVKEGRIEKSKRKPTQKEKRKKPKNLSGKGRTV